MCTALKTVRMFCDVDVSVSVCVRACVRIGDVIVVIGGIMYPTNSNLLHYLLYGSLSMLYFSLESIDMLLRTLTITNEEYFASTSQLTPCCHGQRFARYSFSHSVHSFLHRHSVHLFSCVRCDLHCTHKSDTFNDDRSGKYCCIFSCCWKKVLVVNFG